MILCSYCSFFFVDLILAVVVLCVLTDVFDGVCLLSGGVVYFCCITCVLFNKIYMPEIYSFSA